MSNIPVLVVPLSSDLELLSAITTIKKNIENNIVYDYAFINTTTPLSVSSNASLLNAGDLLLKYLLENQPESTVIGEYSTIIEGKIWWDILYDYGIDHGITMDKVIVLDEYTKLYNTIALTKKLNGRAILMTARNSHKSILDSITNTILANDIPTVISNPYTISEEKSSVDNIIQFFKEAGIDYADTYTPQITYDRMPLQAFTMYRSLIQLINNQFKDYDINFDRSITE